MVSFLITMFSIIIIFIILLQCFLYAYNDSKQLTNIIIYYYSYKLSEVGTIIDLILYMVKLIFNEVK